MPLVMKPSFVMHDTSLYLPKLSAEGTSNYIENIFLIANGNNKFVLKVTIIRVVVDKLRYLKINLNKVRFVLPFTSLQQTSMK